MENSCSALETIINFSNYVTNLRDVTSDNITVGAMQSCRVEICTALYGTGSADVSGIGVAVGYFIEFGMALILTVTMIFLQRSRKHKVDMCRSVTKAFADSAIALTLSVELASAIMLIKKNFGLRADEFGGLTVQIVWIVAALVMLPIVHFCWQDLRDRRSEVRLCAITLAFVLFSITFICRMISTYSSGQVGGGKDALISTEEADQIQYLCFGSRSELSSAGSVVVEIFSIGASLWISCNVILSLLDKCVDDSGDSYFMRVWRGCMWRLKDEKMGSFIAAAALCCWSIPLFWGMLTLRSWQREFAESLGQQTGTDTWSFGQIIAVVVFLPVLNELLFQYLDRGTSSQSTETADPDTVLSKGA